MKLFQTYTGSAFLNQALLTLENLTGKEIAGLDTVDILSHFQAPYERIPISLTSINKRLKSYTMVFTKNGPLHNDKDKGEAVYNSLIKGILEQPENEGNKICELSGLRYNTSFETHYQNALKNVNYTQDKLAKKDLTINRCWFPLIGGLGSDAQALPQASFAINIHPVCIAVLQFLPLSALLYKGGVLLVDSPDIRFTKRMVAYFVERVKGAIATQRAGTAIENIKDFNKGDYLIEALKRLSKQESDFGNSCGFNFWSFSNSGTGANCFIDRIPNDLVRKLRLLYEDHQAVGQLKAFLSDPKRSEDFLASLEDNRDYRGLYPAKGYDGADIHFFERYQEIIGNNSRVGNAKYIASLLRQQSLNADEQKFLEKSDAYVGDNRKRYGAIISKLLREAAERQLWLPLQHLAILDNATALPLNSSISRMYAIVHYYYRKLEEEAEDIPEVPEENDSPVYRALKAFLYLLATDKDNRTQSQLSGRDYNTVTFQELLWRTGSKRYNLEELYPLLYDGDNKAWKNGLRQLLRIFLAYHKDDLSAFAGRPPLNAPKLTKSQQDYLERLQKFSDSYFNYYQTFKNNGRKDLAAFREHVLKPMIGAGFRIENWLDEVLVKIKAAFSEDTAQLIAVSDKSVFSDSLLYDFLGNYNPHFARFAIAFYLHQHYHHSHKTKQPQHG